MKWRQAEHRLEADGAHLTYRITQIPDIRPHYQLSLSDGGFGGAFATVPEAQQRAEEIEQRTAARQRRRR